MRMLYFRLLLARAGPQLHSSAAVHAAAVADQAGRPHDRRAAAAGRRRPGWRDAGGLGLGGRHQGGGGDDDGPRRGRPGRRGGGGGGRRRQRDEMHLRLPARRRLHDLLRPMRVRTSGPVSIWMGVTVFGRVYHLGM